MCWSLLGSTELRRSSPVSCGRSKVARDHETASTIDGLALDDRTSGRSTLRARRRHGSPAQHDLACVGRR